MKFLRGKYILIKVLKTWKANTFNKSEECSVNFSTLSCRSVLTIQEWMDRNATQTEGEEKGVDGKTATLMSQQVQKEDYLQKKKVQKEELAVHVPYLTHNSFR